MTSRSFGAIILWLAVLVVAAVLVSRTPFLMDMSIFLPRNPDADQSLFVKGVSSGASARTVLLAVDGVPPSQHGKISADLSALWEDNEQVDSVLNGRRSSVAADGKLLYESRYLLSPGVNNQSFEPAALKAALQKTVQMLRSSVGMFAKDQLFEDPTGEAARVLNSVVPDNQPRTSQGVWVTQDGRQLLFVLLSKVSGTDLDGQQGLQEHIRSSLQTYQQKQKLPGLTIAMTGSAVFGVSAREMIRDDLMRLSTLGIGLIATLLWFAFRSIRAVSLTLVPMLSAVLIGAGAVSLVFGNLHGLTLGFGAALIGETVDYAIYHLASYSGAAKTSAEQRRSFWAPVRLGVLTSIAGFAALLFSGFPGLAQLAVFAIAGVSGGYAVARWVLPVLTPLNYQPRSLAGLGNRLFRLMHIRTRVRLPIVILTLAAMILCFTQRDQLWDHDMASLNPVTKSAQEMDYAMRQAVGEQGMRIMVLVRSKNEENLLEATHEVTRAMQKQVEAGNILGFSSPSTILPPLSLQRQRQNAIPEADKIRENLAIAAKGLPLKPDRFASFLNDLDRTRKQDLLTIDSFHGTQLGRQLQTMIVRQPDGLTALLPVGEPFSGEVDLERLTKALPTPDGATVTVLDLKERTNTMYAGYLREAIWLSLIGGLIITALLSYRLGAIAPLIRVVVPVLSALSLVMAGLVLFGQSLHLLHLVGLLLVAAVGSNYALVIGDFRTSGRTDTDTLGSLCVANATTLCGYSVLASSDVPLLSALGLTVALGAPLVLLIALLWSGGEQLHQQEKASRNASGAPDALVGEAAP
ncbi:MAG: MMPL family transporter [Burkholderiaceae bacterium]